MNTAADVIGGIGLVKTSKIILKKLETKQITFDGFMLECAYWAIKDGFNELVPKQQPTKPKQVIDFEALDKWAKDKYDWQKLRENRPKDHEIIRGFYEQVSFVNSWNKGTLEWLKEIKKYLLEDDSVNHAKVQGRIFDFEPKFMETFDATQIY